ncbi:MAG TPA: ATP-binding protein [Prolixibacteraceae bacterium]
MKNVALHILDLVQNSARAKAGKVQISINEDPGKDIYLLSVEDDGEGMEEEQLQKATDPFFTTRTTRKVGLGLSLIRQNAERTGGSFSLSSVPGKGTRLEAAFVMNHPDRLPLGEIDDVLVLLAVGLPHLRLIYNHTAPGGQYKFDTEAIGEIIGDIKDCNLEIRKFLREMIIENLKEIRAEAYKINPLP